MGEMGGVQVFGCWGPTDQTDLTDPTDSDKPEHLNT
jgi:hypothetical protein